MRFQILFLILFGVLLASTAVEAQIRFTRSDIEPVLMNGTVTMYDATDAEGRLFNLGSKGSGNTWDFTVFQYTPSSFDRVFVDPGTTPYSDMFQSATHSQMIDSEEEAYSYYILNDNGMYSLGIGTEVQGLPYILAYEPPMPELLFPLQLNSKWSYSGDPVSPLEGYFQETETSIEAISSGTLVTPQGSFEALCIKNTTKLTTRFEIGGQVLSEGYTTSTDYMFMSKNGVSATLSVDSNDVDSMNPSLVDAGITVEGAVNSAAQNPELYGFMLDAAWPNPSGAGSPVNIAWTQDRASSVEITMHDMLGREVRTVFAGHAPAGRHSLTVPTGDLPAGMYLLRGTSAGIHGGLQRIAIVR